jgi:Response regulator receiver domain
MLLDLRMPGVDGMEVLRRVPEIRPQVKVVIITAYGSIEAAVEAMKLGAVDFLQKPFDPEVVREMVSSLLDQATQLPRDQGEHLISPFTRPAPGALCREYFLHPAYSSASGSWNGRLPSVQFPVSDTIRASGVQANGGHGPKHQGKVDVSARISTRASRLIVRVGGGVLESLWDPFTVIYRRNFTSCNSST